jgi:hypothetical protein
LGRERRGRTSTPLVRFNDLNRPSSRRDFATDGKRLFFAIEDRRSEVFVAEMITK